jgi:uncharacterized protein DUF533
MIKDNIVSYFVNDDFSFTIYQDEKGKKVGKLINLQSGEELADNLYQRVFPENIENLVNVVRIIISAAWQDGKILPSERAAFNTAFSYVKFTDEQKELIEKEFTEPTPWKDLIGLIKTREEKLVVLETSLLLILADNEFHPKEKEFIETLVKEFDLQSDDFALLYYILPQEIKQYIVKEKIHTTLEIDTKAICALDNFMCEDTGNKAVDHKMVYMHFVNSWKNKSTRYKRKSVY